MKLENKKTLEIKLSRILCPENFIFQRDDGDDEQIWLRTFPQHQVKTVYLNITRISIILIKYLTWKCIATNKLRPQTTTITFENVFWVRLLSSIPPLLWLVSIVTFNNQTVNINFILSTLWKNHLEGMSSLVYGLK